MLVLLIEGSCGHKGLNAEQHRDLKSPFTVTSPYPNVFTLGHGLVQEEQLAPKYQLGKHNMEAVVGKH